MTTPALPFVAQLRTRGDAIRLGAPDEPVVSVRVQVPEVWDLVHFEAPPTTPVRELKRLALLRLFPVAEHLDEFVVKLAGWEVLDESWSIGDAGVVDGSTLLVTGRRRRPIK